MVAAAVGSLALGIGANTIIFTFVNAAFLKPFGYREPDRLVRMFAISRDGGVQQFHGSLRELLDLCDQSPALAGIAAQEIGGPEMNLTGPMLDLAEHVSCARVTANYFQLLGVRPVLGADFEYDQNLMGRNDAILISNRFWRERLGADAAIAGKVAQVDGHSYRIIGVLPPGDFDRQRWQVWLPMSYAPKDVVSKRWMTAIARLRPGVSMEQANAVAKLSGMSGEPYQSTWEYRDTRKMLLLAFGAAGFVLLIACANVANLLLARAAARRHEVAIRLSIGAGRFRLVRQSLTESMLLAMAGAGCGALLSVGALPLARRIIPAAVSFLPVEANPTLDWRVLLFAGASALLAGVVFGLAPALEFSAAPAPRLARRGRKNRLQAALLTVETALAVVLAAGAGLMVHSFARLNAVDPGFRPERTLTWSVSLGQKRYTPEEARAYVKAFLERLRQIPAIEAVATANSTPMASFSGHVSCGLQKSEGMYWVVTPEYLPATRIRILSGRWLSPSDRAGAPPVAVIDQKVARDCYGEANPLGQTIRLMPNLPPLQVVGVAGSVKSRGSMLSWGGVYISAIQMPDTDVTRQSVFLARTREDASALTPTIRAIAASLDKDQAIFKVDSMEHILATDVDLPRFRATLFGGFGALALLLAVAGVYGVLHYAVAQRTHEIGVRMALGARNGDILRLVMRQSMMVIAAGLTIGIAATLALTRLLARFLFEIKPRDPATLIVVCVVVAGAALFAAWFPARRAAGIEPVVTLRHE